MEDRPERFIWFDYKKEEIFRRLCFIQKIRFTFAPCSNISLLAALLLFVPAKTPDVVMLLKTETPVGAILAGVFELNQLLVISYWLSVIGYQLLVIRTGKGLFARIFGSTDSAALYGR